MSKPPKPDWRQTALKVRIDGHDVEIPMTLAIEAVAEIRRSEMILWIANASDEQIIMVPLFEKDWR